MQRHAEDLENRNCCNNLRLRGLPEATGPEDLAETVRAILYQLLDSDPPTNMEFDRVHRALGPKLADQDCLRDVICLLHRYSQKERILIAAWLKGQIIFDGTSISIFLDVSRVTLQRRMMLKPLLEALGHAKLPYRWGFPLQLIIRKGVSSFTLRRYADLPDLFVFLEVDAIPLQDWLHPLPRREPHSAPLELDADREIRRQGGQPIRRSDPVRNAK